MSSGNQRYINTAGTHNITMGDDFINVSTSVGAITLVFPNIRDSGAIPTNKVWFVNDVDDMAATNNVTIVASATTPATELNGGSSVVLNTNGFSAEIVPSGYYSYMVNSGISDGGMTGSGTLNYVAKFTPSGTILGNSQLFDNGTNVGLGIILPTSKFHIQGVDATNSNYALKVDNSASTNIAHFRNDQFVGFGTTTEIIGATGHKFEVNGVVNGALGADFRFSAAFSTSDAYNVDVGAGIALGGKYNSGGLINPFAGIGGVKLNATDGSFEGRLNLWVRNGSTAATSFTSIPFASKVRNGMGIKNPLALLHLVGDNADVFISETNCINTIGYGAKLLANVVNTQNNVALFAQATNGLKNYAAILEGNINTNIQIGNAGLASGDLYVDTAANILANGDYVVGRKA